MSWIGDKNGDTISPIILEHMGRNMESSDVKGEPVKCTSNEHLLPMINHTFDYSELLEYYRYR